MVECRNCNAELDAENLYLPCPYCGAVVGDEEDEDEEEDFAVFEEEF